MPDSGAVIFDGKDVTGLKSVAFVSGSQSFDLSALRLAGQVPEPGTWLTDLPVYFDPDPKVWLDHRLVDIPLARMAARCNER